MSKAKWNEDLASLNEKLSALGDRAKETAGITEIKVYQKIEDLKGDIAAAEIKAEDNAEVRKQKMTGELLAAKMDIEAKIEDAKENAAAAHEHCREISERGEEKISAELLKAQMDFEALQEKLREKKDAHDAKHLEAYIDSQIEHAVRCHAHAAALIEDARVSVLEALAAAAEYEEKYGEQ